MEDHGGLIMAAQYVVTGPLAVARTDDGGQVYVYNGHALPENVTVEEAERLVETGLVEKVDGAGDKPKPPVRKV